MTVDHSTGFIGFIFLNRIFNSLWSFLYRTSFCGNLNNLFSLSTSSSIPWTDSPDTLSPGFTVSKMFVNSLTVLYSIIWSKFSISSTNGISMSLSIPLDFKNYSLISKSLNWLNISMSTEVLLVISPQSVACSFLYVTLFMQSKS